MVLHHNREGERKTEASVCVTHYNQYMGGVGKKD
jgi:hypothetical protein